MFLIFGFLLVFIFGYLLSVVLVEKIQLLERLGVSFLLGFGIFTLFMFCYSTLGVKITLESTIFALFICILLLTVIAKIFKRKLFVNVNPFKLFKSFLSFSRLEKVITLAIAAFGIGSLIITTYFPVYIWDALALYDFRGKIIAQQGFYTQIANKFFWFGGYPLFTSLSHTIVYLFGGSNPQFLYTLMYLSFIIIFFNNLREFVSRKSALIASLILATTPVIFDHSTFAYTNLPYTIFLASGSIYLFNWFVKKKSIGYLIISAFLTGLSTWTRSTEPFWMVNIFLLLILSVYKYKRYFVSLVVYFFSLSLIREPWNIVNYYVLSSTGTPKTSLVVSEAETYTSALFHTPIDFIRILEVGKFLYQNVIVSWYPLLFIFLFCFVINVKGIFKKASTIFLLVIFVYFGLLLYSTYVYSLGVPYWNTIPDSAKRMAMFFIPMMIYYLGLTLGQLDKKR